MASIWQIVEKINEFKETASKVDFEETKQKLAELPQEIKEKFREEFDVIIAGGRVIETLTNDKWDAAIEKAIEILK